MLAAAKLAGATIFFMILWFCVDWAGAAAALRHADPFLIAAAFAASVLNVLISAGKWQLLLHRARIRLSYDMVAQLYWIGAFFSNFLPTGIGGDVVRLTLTPAKGQLGTVAGSILAERLTGLLVMLVLSALALVLLPLDLGHGVFGLTPALAIVGLIGAVTLVLLAPGWILSLIAYVNDLLPPACRAPLGFIHRIAGTILGSAWDAATIGWAVLLSLPFYGAVILAQYFMLHAVGAEVAISAVILGAPLVSLVALLPVTINGLFLVEGAFVLIFASVGVAPEIALAAATLRRLVDLANSGMGGLMWLAWQPDGSSRNAHERASAPASDVIADGRLSRAGY